MVGIFQWMLTCAMSQGGRVSKEGGVQLQEGGREGRSEDIVQRRDGGRIEEKAQKAARWQTQRSIKDLRAYGDFVAEEARQVKELICIV